MDELTLSDIYYGSSDRALALRGLILAVVVTPFLLLPSTAREIASTEAFAVAVASGVALGVGVGALPNGIALGANYSDATMTVVGLLCIGVATVLVWLLVPEGYLSAFTQFCVVFVWSMALTEVTRHVVWPAVVGPEADRR